MSPPVVSRCERVLRIYLLEYACFYYTIPAYFKIRVNPVRRVLLPCEARCIVWSKMLRNTEAYVPLLEPLLTCLPAFATSVLLSL